MTHLRWVEHRRPPAQRSKEGLLERVDLLIGEAPCMVSLQRSRGVQFYLDTELPIRTRKHYGFLEPMQAEVLALVEKWLALTYLHDASFEDGGGI